MLAARRAALTDPAAPPLPSPPTGTARGDYSPRELIDRIRAASEANTEPA